MGRGAAGARRSGAPLKDGERPPAAPPAGLGRGGAPLSFSFLLQVKYSVTFAKNTTTSTALTQSTVTQGTSTVSPRPCVSVEPALGQPAGGFPAAPRGSEPSGQPGSALGNRAWGAGGSGPGRAALGSRDPPSVRPRLPPGILVRYIYVSRQCTKSCPVIPAAEVVSKPFVLVKPTPFLFAMCCQRSLCNIHSPFINDTELDYRGAGQARGGHAGLVLLLSLAAASLALRLC